MLIFIFTIMALSAFFLMFFTVSDLKSNLLNNTEKSIKNVLYLVNLNIKNQYTTLLMDKITTLKRRKNILKKNALIVSETISRFFKNRINKKEDLSHILISWLSKLNKKLETHFFIFAKNGTLLYHQETNWIGRNLYQIMDVKEVPLPKAVVEKISDKGEAFETFLWSWEGQKSAKELGYFVPLPDNNILGCSIPIHDIETEMKRRLNMVISQLRKSMLETKISDSGFFMVLNGNKEFIIHPTLHDSTTSTEIIDYLKRKNLLTKIVQTKSKNENIFSTHISINLNSKQEIFKVLVSYFRPLDWYIVACVPQQEMYATVRKIIFKQLFIISIISVIGVFATYILTTRITKPINKLTSYARNLLNKDFSKPSNEPSKIPILSQKYKDEVGRLAEAFAFLENSLYDYVQNLKETTAIKERIESELKIAHNIQMSILPKTFPPVPKRSEIDLFALLRPAREVGGDFYDFFYLDKDNLFFTIGDVSGKGVPASLFMAITRTLIKASAGPFGSPDKILWQVNRTLAEDNEACIFVTLFCGILNLNTGHLFYSNAGHNPPILVSEKSGKVETLKVTPNMAAGVIPDIQYNLQEWTLECGDMIFLYTDGVTEAMNKDEDFFGLNRLNEALLENIRLSPQLLCNVMMEKIDRFTDGASQSDDITMMTLKFMGSNGSNKIL